MMKGIIRNILDNEYEEKDIDLANIANDLMEKLANTFNCPSNWRNVLEELYEEYKDNEWIIEAVYEFGIMADNEEE